MSKQVAKNTFTGGLQMDLNPLSSQNTVLTNALNATLVTIDGDEMILQNDMGNLKATYTVDNKELEVTLTPGFIPIGINTLNGIAYIVSFNPNTQEGEIGTFPSPQYNLEGDLLINDNNDNNTLINKYQPLYNLYKGSVDNQVLSPKQQEIVRLLWAMRTTHFNFDLEHPVSVELQPSYDGSVNIIINDGKNIPRLINSRFSAKEDGTWEIPSRNRNINNIYKVYEDVVSSSSPDVDPSPSPSPGPNPTPAPTPIDPDDPPVDPEQDDDDIVPVEVSDNEILYKAGGKLIPAPDVTGYGYNIAGFMGVDREQLTITSHTFNNCIGRIKFNKPLKYIGEDTFLRCESLQVIVFPSKAIYFEDSALWGCKNLEAIVIKAPLTKPDIEAFDLTNDCPIYVPDEGIEQIKTIPHWPYWEDRLVPISQMPADLITECGEKEIQNKTIVYYSPSILPESIYDATQGVHLGRFGNAVSYGQTFEKGKGTISFNIDLKLVGTYAFYRCDTMTKVILPDSITNIYANSFFGCTNLQEVSFPNSLTSIGMYAFRECRNLLSVELPDSISLIDEGAFASCDKLNSVYIGKNITNIKEAAFANCFKLDNVRIAATTPPTIEEGAFRSCSDNLKIYVPSGTVESYKTAWSDYSDKIFELPSRRQALLYSAATSSTSSKTYKEPMCECNNGKLVNGIKDMQCGCHDISCQQEIKNQQIFDITTSLNKRLDFFPIIKYEGVLNNGNLPVGNYTLYFKYCDEDGNETDFVAESGIISIFKGNDGDPFSIDGGERDMNSNKSIRVTLIGDYEYKFVKVYYARTSAAADENRVVSVHEIIKEYPITDNNRCDIIITGDEEKVDIPVSDLNQSYSIINNAETQVQINNRLFLGNVENQDLKYKELKDISLRIVPFVRREEASNKIGYVNQRTYKDSSAIVSPNEFEHRYPNEYYNTKNIYYNVGYWNEEYYRLGIVYIYDDGSLSPTFNILGYRTADNIYGYSSKYSVLNSADGIKYNNEQVGPNAFKFNIPSIFDSSGQRQYLQIDDTGDYFKSTGGINSVYQGITKINTRGVIQIVDSELYNNEAKEYLYNLRVFINSDIVDYLKNNLCIKGFFIVRQKRIPTILAQGFTLPWDKEAKVPIIEHWNTRVMPIRWKFSETFKNYKANDEYGNNFTWHYYWNKVVPNKYYALTNLRCYEVESFLDQLSEGGKHLSTDDGWDYGYPSNRKLLQHYLPRLHDIPFICVDQMMLMPYSQIQQSINDNPYYIKTYSLQLGRVEDDTVSSWTSIEEMIGKCISDKSNTKVVLKQTVGETQTTYNSSSINFGNYADYNVDECYITTLSQTSPSVETFTSRNTTITVPGIGAKDYQSGDMSYASAQSAAMNIAKDTNNNSIIYIHRYLKIILSKTSYSEDTPVTTTTEVTFSISNPTLVNTFNPKEDAPADISGYQTVSDINLYQKGYLRHKEYFRDQFIDTVDGKVVQNDITGFSKINSYRGLARSYGDKLIRRLGNYYMLWKIRKNSWKEIADIWGADSNWTEALKKHYGDLYQHVDGNQLTAICPEFEVRQPFFNQLFTGSEYPVRYTTYQHGVLNRDSKNERYYYQNVISDDIYCPSNTHDFNKFGTRIGMKYKICSVTDSVPIVAIDNTIFQSILGTAEEAYRIAYINEEHSGKAQWTLDDNHDNHYHTNENKEDWNLARGIFSPYLGMISNVITKGNVEQNERDRRYCRTFNVYINDFNNDNQFDIRYKDNSPYYAISERICFNYNYKSIIKELNNSDNNLTYDLYRGDCFLCTFTHRLNRNFNDPTAPSNDKIVDEATWIKHYQPDEDATKDDITQISKINRGDVNAIKLGSWITVKVRSSYNLSIRSLDERYTTESAMMGRARGFYPLQQASADGGYKIPNSYLINDGFGSTVGEKIYNVLPEAPYYNNYYEDRIIYSDVNIQDAFKNGYRVFKSSSITDYTKQYGKIVKLVDWYGHIICVFEHAVGILPVNERVESGQGIGGPVFIDNNKVLPDTPSIISDKFGSFWKDSIIKTPYAIYGVDTSTKKIWKVTGSTTLPTLFVISDFKVENFLKEHLNMNDTEQQVQIALRNVKSHYNQTKSDVIFTFYMTKTNRLEGQQNKEKYDEEAWSLCLNEITSDQNSGNSGNFVTFYSWIPLESFNLNNKFYSFDRNLVRGILSFYDIEPIPNEELIEYIGKPVYDQNGILVDESTIDYCSPEETYYRRTYKYPKECMTALNIWEHNNPFIRPLPTHWYGHQHPFEFEFVVIEDPSVQKIYEDLKIISNNAKPESFHFAISGDNYEFTEDIPNIFYRQEATKELYSNLGSPISYNKDYIKVHPNQQIKSTIFPLYYNRIDVYDNIYDLYQQMTGDYRDYQNLSGTEIYRNPRSRKYELVTHIKNTPIDGEWIRITKQNAEELLKDQYDPTKDFDTQLEELYNLYYTTFNTSQKDCNLKFKKIKNPEQAFECDDNNYWYYLWIQQSRLRGNSHYKEDKWNIQIPTITLMQKNESKWEDGIPPLVLNWIPKLKNYEITGETLPNTYNIGQVSTDKWTFRKETKLRDKYCKIKVRYSGEELAIISAVLTTFNISYA